MIVPSPYFHQLLRHSGSQHLGRRLDWTDAHGCAPRQVVAARPWQLLRQHPMFASLPAAALQDIERVRRYHAMGRIHVRS